MPPHLADEEDQRIANLLYMLAWFGMLIFAVDILMNLLLSRYYSALFVAVDSGLVLLLLLSLGIVKRHVRRSAWVFTLLSWLLTVILTLPFSDSPYDPYYNGFLMVIIAAGLLINGRAGIAVAAASALVTLLPLLSMPARLEANLPMWADLTLLFMIAGLLMYVVDGSLKGALAQARQTERRLTASNRALQDGIEEREAIARTLRETQRQYEILLDRSPVGVFVFSLEPPLPILYANPAGAHLLGAQTPHEILQHEVADFFLPEWHDTLHQRVDLLRSGTETASLEYAMLRLDGQSVPIEVRSVPIWYHDKPAVLTIMQDMTLQKQAERERLAAETLRIELEKERQLLSMKEQFIAMVSHEFRTPLSVILSSKELLEHYYDDLSTERRHSHLEKIDVQVRTMVEMLNDILTINRTSAGMIALRPMPVNIAAFCEALIAELAPANSMHAFTRDIAELAAGGVYLADQRALRQIVYHLLSNAVKYSPDGGSITLAVHAETEGLRFEVSDAGIGIPVSDQKNLFQPFHRAANAQPFSGTGLGLAIVKSQVNLYGGRISLKSNEGQGTTVSVWLPLTPVPALQQHDTPLLP